MGGIPARWGRLAGGGMPFPGQNPHSAEVPGSPHFGGHVGLRAPCWGLQYRSISDRERDPVTKGAGRPEWWGWGWVAGWLGAWGGGAQKCNFWGPRKPFFWDFVGLVPCGGSKYRRIYTNEGFPGPRGGCLASNRGLSGLRGLEEEEEGSFCSFCLIPLIQKQYMAEICAAIWLLQPC